VDLVEGVICATAVAQGLVPVSSVHVTWALPASLTTWKALEALVASWSW